MYVQLHGLPLFANTSHIKKFFSGLPVKSIYILLSNNVHVPQLDAIGSYPNDSDDNDRFGTTFRLFVKFNSAPIATIALQRSGETIANKNHQQPYQDDDTTHNPSYHYSIGVSQLTKHMANILSKLVCPLFVLFL